VVICCCSSSHFYRDAMQKKIDCCLVKYLVQCSCPLLSSYLSSPMLAQSMKPRRKWV
jgi:hypothetical protein